MSRRVVLGAAILALCLLASSLPPGEAAVVSGRLWLDEIGVRALREKTGATGEGVVIAVVDTGVDPGIDALHGIDRAKIVDWVDLTGEGWVDTTLRVRGAGDFLTVAGRAVRLGNTRSLSGTYGIGWLRESWDMDGNGRTHDVFLVVAIDSVRAGVYDRVVIDVAGDFDLRNDAAIWAYRRFREYVTLGSGARHPRAGVSLMVCHIAADGSHVELGFDGHGHGTQMAAIAAAAGTGNPGVAPGARLLAIKALSSDGTGSWTDVAAGVEEAIMRGAHVILVSVTAVGQGAPDAAESHRLRQLASRHGAILVMAVGNRGPGLGTAAPPVAGDATITAGAYSSLAMWLEQGVSGQGESIPVYSGVGGPTVAGPTLVAPGSAVTYAPAWLGGTVQSIEGTSVSAAYVAGALALLLESAHDLGIRPGFHEVFTALAESARPVSGYNGLEQGFGLLQVDRAWSYLQAGGLPAGARATFVSPAGTAHATRVLGAPLPPRAQLQFTNAGTRDWNLTLASEANWLGLSPSTVRVPGGQSRRVAVEHLATPGPGLHVAEIEVRQGGRFEDTAYLALVLPHLGADMGGRFFEERTLSPGQMARYFVQVEPGTLNLTVEVGAVGPEPGAGLQLLAYDPGGRLAGQTSARPVARLSWDRPAPGIWEVVVHGHPGGAPAAFRIIAQLDAYRVTWLSPTDPALVVLQLQRLGPEAAVRLGVFRERGAAGTQVLTVEPGSTLFQTLRPVPSGLELLTVRIGKGYDPEIDLDLFLYYYDPVARRWVEVGASRTLGSSSEQVVVRAPAAGSYVAAIEARGGDAGVVVEFGYEESLRQPMLAGITPARLALGDGEGARVTLAGLPVEHLDDLYLAVTPEVGTGLGALPIPTARHLLRVELLASSDGREALLTVREAATLRAVSGTALVAGVLYPVDQGRAWVRLPGGAGRVSVQAQSRDGRGFFQGDVQILGRRMPTPEAAVRDGVDERILRALLTGP